MALLFVGSRSSAVENLERVALHARVLVSIRMCLVLHREYC